MRILVCIIALFVSLQAIADDLPAPLTAGQVAVKIGISVNPNALQTASVSLRRVATGKRVLCIPIADLAIVDGVTDPIENNSPVVWLEGIAWSEAGCAGIESLPSVDRYVIVFTGPGRPVLLIVP